MKRNKLKYTASVMCADLLNLERDLAALERSGFDELHYDIMDGVFVPNLTLGFDVIRLAKARCGLPASAHLMLAKPEKYIERFVDAGCDSVIIHVEACTHAPRTLAAIRDLGASPGIAINPATPLTKLDYLLEYVDRILVMTVDPGYAGQSLISSSFERVKILRDNVSYRERNIDIEVDGNISATNAAILANQGASRFVLGTASVFNARYPQLDEALPKFRDLVDTERAVV
ncbi:MAG: ribulose-phosphate 3-epimerase [Phycisphaerae bacterium]|nr:MAG: ribulose-phosphate 3-epimerase [Phycisphaerae bacterium]